MNKPNPSADIPGRQGVMTLDAEVSRAFAAEDRHLAQAAIFEHYEGPDAIEALYLAVAEGAPRRILEVGCGQGELAVRMARELHATVMAVDISPRMVELACRRGVAAQVGDVRDLPFATGAFDTVVANWVLNYVRGIDRALREIARVLRPGARLVASTNSDLHLHELWGSIFGSQPVSVGAFSREKAPARLKRHFRRIEVRDINGTVTFPDHAAAKAYVSRTIGGPSLADHLAPFSGVLRASRRSAVLVAEL